MKTFDIVVIGGGPAGITLAKLLGKTFSTAIIRPEDFSMIYCAMPYAIEGLIDTEVTFKSDKLVTDAGAALIRKTVKAVDYDQKLVLFEDDSSIAYGKLVLATGATPFIPPIKGSTLKGVGAFKTQADLMWIENLVNHGLKRAVVVGAGAIGIELAQALSFRDVIVDLIDIASSVLPNLVDTDMAGEFAREIESQSIRLHLNSRVSELKGDDVVRSVLLDTGEQIDFDPDEKEVLTGVVLFAAGMKPDLSLVQESPLELGKDGIIVDDVMQTSMQDVYAVGDCAQFHSGITGKPLSGKLATNAVPMAKVLGLNLLGHKRTYPGFYNGAATKVGKYFIGGTGLSETAARNMGYDVVCGYSQVTTKFPIMPEAKKKRMKVVVDAKTHRVLGAQIVSGEPVVGRIDLLTFSIQKESTIEDLSALSYASQPHQSFYPAANIVVLAAEDVREKQGW
jgi:NADH oxidase (H2O2-forming)